MAHMEGVLLDGLPVRVVDEAYPGTSIALPKSLVLKTLSWRGKLGAPNEVKDAIVRFFNSAESDDAIQDHQEMKYASNWWKRPYAHLFLSTTPQYEAYKDPRSRLREFIDSCTDKMDEWLVIYASQSEDSVSRTEKRALEKLRTALVTGKGKERCYAFKIQESGELDLNSWTELQIRLKECVRDALETKIQAYEEQVNQVYANRILPGWSFTQYVSISEGLVFIYIQLKRHDLAFLVYDELEKIMDERQERGSGFFAPSERLVVDIVNPRTKNYRQQINAGTITELDLRTYLFASRMDLLVQDNKFMEASDRGYKFLSAMEQKCREEAAKKSSSVPPVLPYLFGFLAARSLVDAISVAIRAGGNVPHPDATLRRTARAVAGFYLHAMEQFRIVSAVVLPGALMKASGIASDERNVALVRSVQNDILKRALATPEAAQELYVQMALQAANKYELGGRVRGASRIRLDVGRVMQESGAWGRSLELLAGPCSQFTMVNGWDRLHRECRTELAMAEKQQQKVQEYLLSSLAMLRMTRTDRRMANVDEIDYALEAQKWANEALQTASQLPRVMKFKLKRLLDVRVLPQKSPWMEGEKASIDVVLISHVPCTLSFNSMVLELCLDDGKEADKEDTNVVLRMTTQGSMEVVEGQTVQTAVVDEIPQAGRYRMTSLNLFLEKLKLSLQDGDHMNAPRLGGPAPSFLCKSTSPLHVGLRSKEELLLIDSYENTADYVLTAGVNGYYGKVELTPTLLPQAILGRDVQISAHLFAEDRNGSDGNNSGSLETEVELAPGESTTVGLRLKATSLQPQRVEEDGFAALKTGGVGVRTKVNTSYAREGKQRYSTLMVDSELHFVDPLNFTSSSKHLDLDRCLVSIRIENRTSETALEVTQVDLQIPDSVGTLETAGALPHVDLLPATILPASFLSVVCFVTLRRDRSPHQQPEDVEAAMAKIRVGVSDPHSSEKCERYVNGFLDLSTLPSGRCQFRVTRRADLVANLGSIMPLQFEVKLDREEGASGESPRCLYEFSADPEQWLFAGRRRGLIHSASASGELQIIPIKSGLLHLPTVRILHADTLAEVNAIVHVDNEALQVRVLPPGSNRVATGPSTSTPAEASGANLSISQASLSVTSDIIFERTAPRLSPA